MNLMLTLIVLVICKIALVKTVCKNTIALPARECHNYANEQMVEPGTSTYITTYETISLGECCESCKRTGGCNVFFYMDIFSLCDVYTQENLNSISSYTSEGANFGLVY